MLKYENEPNRIVHFSVWTAIEDAKRFFEELERMAAGEEPKGLIRDPARNVRVQLPVANNDTTLKGMTTEQIMKEPRRRQQLTSFILQAGQPDHVRQQMAQAMGVEIEAQPVIVPWAANANAAPTAALPHDMT